ncbi:alpha/beta hydrolase family protein [Burkholderiales bacterium]|jgi:pimeloyl-ACP methyl ester carboxylesterase|nr:alpha/beta hydrolase family protein [Burkholderiales bacterium]MDC3408684.1 alpha/beta hydrolase family protein [Burkholderiales bacterium]
MTSFFKLIVLVLLHPLTVGANDYTAYSDYEREKNWADQIIPSIIVGDPVWIEQSNGHKFLGIYTEAKDPKGAVIIAHGRGWNPDFELYGMLRILLADEGYSTLSLQMPILGGGAKVGDYIPTYPEAFHRFDLAAAFLNKKGFDNISIVSHSLGATMANHYLITVDETLVNSWVFISILNGLQEMFRIKIPVMDVYASDDWEITVVGGYERKQQILKVPGSSQVIISNALHFFERREESLVAEIAQFLDSIYSD